MSAFCHTTRPIVIAPPNTWNPGLDAMNRSTFLARGLTAMMQIRPNGGDAKVEERAQAASVKAVIC
jgi:hypothetical protein